MKKKIAAPILVAAASLVLLLIAGICVKNRDTVPKILGDSNSPQTAVTGFFDALSDGDYDLCASYVSDYASLGFDNIPEKESERMVYECLLESYGYQLLGSIETSSDGIFQRVLITSFDVSRLSDDISERFMPTLEATMAESDNYDAMFDDDGQYSELLIEMTLVDILSELLSEPERYYTTTEQRLELEFDRGEWKLILSDELVKILTGGITEEEAE